MSSSREQISCSTLTSETEQCAILEQGLREQLMAVAGLQVLYFSTAISFCYQSFAFVLCRNVHKSCNSCTSIQCAIAVSPLCLLQVFPCLNNLRWLHVCNCIMLSVNRFRSQRLVFA